MSNGSIADVTVNSSSSFKYKSNLLKGLTSRNIAANTNLYIVEAHTLFSNAQVFVPIKYISIFFRSLEMSIISCKLHLEWNWNKNHIMSSVAGASTFQITNTILYVLIVTLSTKNNVTLRKQLYEGFKRSIY